jgi:hypothetical protein
MREGEMVKNYPQLSVRVPPDARRKVIALSTVCGLPQWRVIFDAVDCYLHGQPADVRHLVERIVAGRSTRAVRQQNKALAPSSAAHRQRVPRRTQP